MLRGSTAADAQFVDVSVTPSNGIDMQYRSAVGGSATDLARIAGVAAPYWVMITSSGNTYTGYASPDGSNWTEVGSISVTMPATATAGLHDCSHSTTALCTSTFQNVEI